MAKNAVNENRLSTGIRGLDLMLNGGFIGGGTYLLMGAPGTGKTILANQFGFEHVAGGGKAVYVTLLAEHHARMLQNVRQFPFFRPQLIAKSFQFLGGYKTLEHEGLEGLLRMLSETVLKFKATVLFIDGVASVENSANDSVSFKKFVHELSAVTSSINCTTFLLSSVDGSPANPEHTMVDGILQLSMNSDEQRVGRKIEVKKFRGSGHLIGKHSFKIGNEGIRVMPRVESYMGLEAPGAPPNLNTFISCGIPSVDEIIGGGLKPGSVTSLLGAVGTGKTIFGCQFLLAGASKGEPSLYFGLYEAPERLTEKLENLGIQLKPQLKSKKLHLHWLPQTEQSLDEMIEDILESVKALKIKRLFFEGIGGLKISSQEADRLPAALAAFTIELRRLDVTTVFTEELETFHPPIEMPLSEISAIDDNVFWFRKEMGPLENTFSFTVLKTRESAHEFGVYPLVIGKKGIQILSVDDGTTKSSSGTRKKR